MLRCHTSNVALHSGVVQNVTNLRSSMCPGVIGIWNAQRMTHICAYTSLGGLQPSKWKFPFLPQSINDWGTIRNDDRTRAVTAKDEFFMCSVGDDGYPHACSRRATWSRASVENEKHGLTSMSKSVARSCPRELLRIVVAVIAVWITKLLRHSARYSSWPKCLRWLGNWSPQGVFTARNQLGGLECVMKSLCVGCI